MYVLDVDDEFLYFSTLQVLYRAEKDGSGEPVTMGAKPTAEEYQSMAFSGDNVFWLAGSSVARWNKSTDETIMFSLEGKEHDIYMIAADDEKLYLSGESRESRGH